MVDFALKSSCIIFNSIMEFLVSQFSLPPEIFWLRLHHCLKLAMRKKIMISLLLFLLFIFFFWNKILLVNIHFLHSLVKTNLWLGYIYSWSFSVTLVGWFGRKTLPLSSDFAGERERGRTRRKLASPVNRLSLRRDLKPWSLTTRVTSERFNHYTTGHPPFYLCQFFQCLRFFFLRNILVNINYECAIYSLHWTSGEINWHTCSAFFLSISVNVVTHHCKILSFAGWEYLEAARAYWWWLPKSRGPYAGEDGRGIGPKHKW